MPLLDALAGWAKSTPRSPFLLGRNRQLSYAETWSAVGHVAGALAAEGVRPGDRVVLALPNSVEFCVLLYGVLHAGASAVLVNPRWTPYEIEGVLALVKPRLFVHGGMDVAAGDFSIPATLPAGLMRGVAPAIGRRPSPTGVALMLVTSGTTGKPKAVMLSQEALAANARQLASRKQLTPADRFLCSIPLFHSNGQVAALHSMLVAGASLAILDRPALSELLEAIEGFGVTAISGVPTLYQQLLSFHRESPVDFSRLRLCVSGSAPMPASLFEAVEREFGAFLLEGYGLTESSAGATGNPISLRKPGTVGIALEGTELRIVEPGGPDGEEGRALGSGRAGEVWIRGPQLMQGYFQDPEATRAALTPEGWLRSGDLGELDDDGYLTIRSRLKELIIRAGFNVYPVEVESVLREVRGVLDVTVIGMPDAVNGESVHAALIADVSEAEVVQAMQKLVMARLARYKRPTSISFHRDFPRTGSAKVQKQVLARELLEEPGRVREI